MLFEEGNLLVRFEPDRITPRSLRYSTTGSISIGPVIGLRSAPGKVQTIRFDAQIEGDDRTPSIAMGVEEIAGGIAEDQRKGAGPARVQAA
jgi:hypothetical protein